MHACSPLPAEAPRAIHSVGFRSTRKSGFSLVEVTMAIGIIAFAFVALLGLLPTGLQVFRESIDSANEMWIAQNLNSMVQVTPWSKLKELEKFTFYFDEEGRMTDRESPEGGGNSEDDAVKLRRLYAVKLLIGQPTRPGDSGSDTNSGNPNEYSQNVVRVVAIIAPYIKPTAMTEFKALESIDDVRRLPKRSAIKTRAFLVPRLDSMRDPR